MPSKYSEAWILASHAMVADAELSIEPLHYLTSTTLALILSRFGFGIS
jgi:hypothetical protein